MEKIGDLMRDLGFREDGPDEVKKAFILNLMRAAYPDAKLPPLVPVTTPPATPPVSTGSRTAAVSKESPDALAPLGPAVAEGEQLSFDFGGRPELGSDSVCELPSRGARLSYGPRYRKTFG